MALFTKYLASAASQGSQLHPLAAAAAALSPPFTRIILLKLTWLSTTVAGNDKSTGYPEAVNTRPVPHFLLNECGLCQSELSAVLKIRPDYIATKYTDRARQAVQLLRNSGSTEEQVRKTITRNPCFLAFNADRCLKPKIEFMKTLGITTQDFGNVICNGHRLLTCSLEKTLYPNVQYFQILLGPDFNFSNVFKWAPSLLTRSNGPKFWENKLKHLASFGLLEDEIKGLVKRHPYILNSSMDKVQKNMDYFMHTAGLPAKFLLSYPRHASCYSLEAKIKPCHKVLIAISAMQPSKRPPSLISVVRLSEKKFLEKYVQCSPHATKLLEIYSGKSAQD